MDVRCTEIDGIPVFWVDSSLPFVCSMFVRMGPVDETLLTAGMSHLLEHLVLATEWPVEEFNATVMPLLTHYWFSGDPAEATSRLAATVDSMREPPLGRLPREREILRTEAYGRGRSQPGLHAALRFGPRGVGLMDYPEHGIQRATRADVLAWKNRFFVRGNVAVAMTQPPPDGLRLDLPDGPNVLPPRVDPIAYLEYPSSFVGGLDGGAAASMIVARSHAVVIALELVTHRLRQWLRHQEGVTYHVGSQYDPISRDQAQLVLWADCRPDSADLVRNALVAVLDDLSSAGPAEAELRRSVDQAGRASRDPAAAYDAGPYACAQHLVGERAETPEEMAALRSALTPEDIAGVVAAGFDTLIVTAPPGTSQLGGRFKSYPVDSPLVIDGKRYSPTDKEREETLVVGTVGVAVEGDRHRAVAYDDAVAHLMWDDGSVALYGSDGFYVVVDPVDWKKGEKAAKDVRARVFPTRAVDVSSTPPTFEDPDLLAGAAAYANEGWSDAVARFELGLARESDSADAWGMLAWALHRSDAPHRAIEAAREAVRLDPHDAWSARFLASRLLDAGDEAEAVIAVREALRRAPVELSTLATAADVLSKADHYDEAERIGRRAAELFPEASSAWFAYGWSARAASHWQAAEEALRRCVELDPTIASWHSNLGVLLLELNQAAEALTSFDRALKLDPEDEYAPSNRVRALHLLGKKKEAAALRTTQMTESVEEATRAIESAPGDPVALEKLARRLMAADRYEEGVARAREAVEIAATPARYQLLAETLGWLDDWAGARAALDSGLALEPEHTGLLEVLAWLAAVTGDSAAAEAAAQRIESRDGSRRAMSASGFAAVATGRWADAEATFDELIALRPLSCCSVAWRGIARLGQGRDDEARADAERVRAMSPWSCASLRHLDLQLAA